MKTINYILRPVAVCACLLFTSGVMAEGNTSSASCSVGNGATSKFCAKQAAKRANKLVDPLKASSVEFVYGGSVAVPDPNDALEFFVNEDGNLLAIDPTTGLQVWSVSPPDGYGFCDDGLVPPNGVMCFNNMLSVNKPDGIGVNPVIQALDNNANGILEPGLGEKAYLYYGMIGDTRYIGIDITSKLVPQLQFILGAGQLPNAGQSWSEPVPARMVIGGGVSQNADKLVLVIGGGNDTSNDAPLPNEPAEPDATGNAIYIIDSVSGQLLWLASSDAGGDLALSAMQYAIPGRVSVLDLFPDGATDGLADRMFATDMGGQVLRFDIFNGENPSNLVTGGAIAQLGAAAAAVPTVSESRRFYYAPDVTLFSDDDQTFFHIGVGSGHLSQLNQTLTQERFYALRDYFLAPQTQSAYDFLIPIAEMDLIDITNDVTTPVEPGDSGWLFKLKTGGVSSGEKAIAEARTLGHRLMFRTFEPSTDPSCDGTDRLYFMEVLNGAPVRNLDGVGGKNNLTESDRFCEF